MAYSYGRNIGIAFQIMDDLLDFTASEDSLGKPSGADLSLGLATAPVLFAAREFPELNELISRQGYFERISELCLTHTMIRAKSQILSMQYKCK